MCGPSHIHEEYTAIVNNEIKSGLLFRNCILNGYRGLPNWSNILEKQFQLHRDKHIVWIVSDYKFNNFDYPHIKTLQSVGELFLNVSGFPGNVDKAFMTPEHIKVLGEHSLKVMNYIIHTYPHIKLIFWCLYKRTKVNTSSYPKHLWYDNIKTIYKSHMIDIDDFTTPAEFATCILDEGGHPNKKGYILMDKMIQSSFRK